MKKWLWLLAAVLFALFLIYHNVSGEVTDQDRLALSKMGSLQNVDHLTDVEKALVLVDQMQVLIRKDFAIPKRNEREPIDLLRYRTGATYDWARSACKFFKIHQIRARQVSLYQTDGGLMSVFNPSIEWWASVEVFQDGVWGLVDPFSGWTTLDADGVFHPTEDINDKTIKWKDNKGPLLHDFQKQRLFPVYGILSRHGQYYPPYSPFPDYNFQDLKLNF